MNRGKTVFCTVLLLSVSLAPLLAGAPAQTGKENAATRISAAMDKQNQVLMGLMDKLPAQALPAVQSALEASLQGRNTALAALAGHSDTESSTPTEAETSTPQISSDSDAADLTRARDAVTTAFGKSVATLQNLLATLPAQAVPHVEAALAKIQQNQTLALQTLDGLSTNGASHRTSLDAPSRPDRPSRPERVERPQIPQRPQRPERPQVPQHP